MKYYIAIYHFNGSDVSVYGPWATPEEAYIFIGEYSEKNRLKFYPDLTEDEYDDKICSDGYWEVTALESPEESLKELR